MATMDSAGTSAKQDEVTRFVKQWSKPAKNKEFEKGLMDLFFNLHLHCSKVAIKIASSKGKSKNGLFASARAKELAAEHGIDEKDLEGTGKNNKILLKDVEKAAGLNGKKKTPKKEKKKKEKHACSGLSKTGNPCAISANHKPEGAKNWYCFRHANNDKWKQYEEDPDSDADAGSVGEGVIEEELYEDMD